MKSHAPPPSTASKSPSGRLVSLDALRGADMFLLVGMGSILRALPQVSDNGVFEWIANQSRHPEWHGYTVWDQIFPLFIFMMGVAMPFSFAKRIELGEKKSIYKHVAIRAVVLFLLGLIFWGAPLNVHLDSKWGFYSVLYRIGFSYFFASLIVLNFKVRGQVSWALGMLLVYFLALRYIPVPGFGAGVYSQEGNLVTFVTEWYKQVLPAGTHYLLSPNLIPSVVNALFGALAGQWLRSTRDPLSKVKGLLLVTVLFIALAFLFRMSIPFCKKLLSTSFTFLSCGISIFLLALFYWVIDVKGHNRWAFFFVVVGMNSITIYLCNVYVDFKRLAAVFVGAFSKVLGVAEPLAVAVVAAALIWLFLYFLYRKKIFLKV